MRTLTILTASNVYDTAWEAWDAVRHDAAGSWPNLRDEEDRALLELLDHLRNGRASMRNHDHILELRRVRFASLNRTDPDGGLPAVNTLRVRTWLSALDRALALHIAAVDALEAA